MATSASPWSAMVPVEVDVICDTCHGVVELACEGLTGTVMYLTYNEFYCPHCRALNRARTPGHIVSVGAKLRAPR